METRVGCLIMKGGELRTFTGGCAVSKGDSLIYFTGGVVMTDFICHKYEPKPEIGLKKNGKTSLFSRLTGEKDSYLKHPVAWYKFKNTIFSR